MSGLRYRPEVLKNFAVETLTCKGMAHRAATRVAEALLEADLLGHSTHGLALLSDYVSEIESGEMNVSGDPEVLVDHGAVVTWDARRLPGLWTTSIAVDVAKERAERLGVGAVAIRRSHHIGCLASFLEAPAREGYLVLIFSSDPSDAHVAPFGATSPVLTPNPIAAGIPGRPDPVLIDVSTSVTTAAMASAARDSGKPLPHKWLLDSNGTATGDAEYFGRGTTILPIGGVDHGHKGYALSFLVEALSQGLSGFGRRDGTTQWGASVLVMVLAPAVFGSQNAFLDQVDFIANACRSATRVPGGKDVRLPGEAGLKRKQEALLHGVTLSSQISEDLNTLARRLELDVPAPMSVVHA